MAQWDLHKIRKVKTREDWDFHVGKYQWFLPKQPILSFYPRAYEVFENLFICFLHATETKKVFSISGKFMVRISTILNTDVFSEAQKHWVISTVTHYGKCVNKNLEGLKSMFKIPY